MSRKAFLQIHAKFVMRTCSSPSIRLFTNVLQIRELVNVFPFLVLFLRDFVSLKIEPSTQVPQINQKLTRLKRNRITFGYLFS